MPCGKILSIRLFFTRESHENWIRTHVETGDVVQMIICDLANDKPLDPSISGILTDIITRRNTVFSSERPMPEAEVSVRQRQS